MITFCSGAVSVTIQESHFLNSTKNMWGTYINTFAWIYSSTIMCYIKHQTCNALLAGQRPSFMASLFIFSSGTPAPKEKPPHTVSLLSTFYWFLDHHLIKVLRMSCNFCFWLHSQPSFLSILHVKHALLGSRPLALSFLSILIFSN